MKLKRLSDWVAEAFGRRTPQNSVRDHLSEGDVERLKALRSHPGWGAYLKALDAVVTLYSEGLLAARDDATLRDHRSLILGVRRAAILVDEILAKEDELERERERRADAGDAESARRRIATFGTPSWGA